MKKIFAMICVSFLAALMVFAGIHTKSPPVAVHDMNGFAVSDMGIPALTMASENMGITNDVYATISTQNLDTQTPTETCAKVYLSSNLINGITTDRTKGVIRPNIWPMTSLEMSLNSQATMKQAENVNKVRLTVAPPGEAVNCVLGMYMAVQKGFVAQTGMNKRV